MAVRGRGDRAVKREIACLSSHMAQWDPQQYQRFTDERSRPFFDLVGRLPDDNVHCVADLGCGPGNLTQTLLTRWPAAVIWGVDNSPEMLATAAKLPTDSRLQFVLSDIATWQPEKPLDRIVSNAALQWVPDHTALLLRLVSWLAPRGVLAVQMPNNFADSNHTLLTEMVTQEPWRSALGGPAERYFIQAPAWYAQTLHELGLQVDLWETIYYHILPGQDAVLEWMKGTALRPILTKLTATQKQDFLTVYGEKLRTVYPSHPHGILFPFRRLFFVVRKK